MPPRSMDASASRKRPRDEAAKAKKPAKQEYVGSPGEALLTEEALRSALAHLAEHDDHMKPLVAEADIDRLSVSLPPQHGHFIVLCEFVVRRQKSVQAANTQLGKLKALVGGTWCPDAVIEHEEALRGYYQCGESGKRIDTILALAAFFSSASRPDLATLSDCQLLDSELAKIKGIGPVALRTLLVHMGRPNVLVAGDALLNGWLEKAHGIEKHDTKVAAERDRYDKTASWAPFRSVGYLLINAAKEGTADLVLA